MKKHTASYLCNAFLLGVITGFLLAPLKHGVTVTVSNHGYTASDAHRSKTSAKCEKASEC